MTKAKKPSTNPPAGRDFHVGVIEAIGSETFFTKIADLTEKHITFDGLFICFYSKNSAPISLGCFKEALNFQQGIENYLKYSYVINPVYRAFQENLATGVYTMPDLLPDSMKDEIDQSDFPIWVDDQEVIGYRTPGWPKKMIEVLGLVQLPDNAMIELCFLNPQVEDQAQDLCADLKVIYPVLSAALLKHYEFTISNFDTSKADPNLESRILDFGTQLLTGREQDVVQMIFKGYSSNAIALELGISLPTVKTHRRNIYAKLEISSQVELFNLFVQKMMHIGT